MPGLGDWLQGGPPPEEPGLGDRLLNQWKASLANRILSAPSKLFGGLVVDPAVEGVTDLVTLAGDVYGGRQPTMSADPQTGEMHTDPRLSERTANAAGTMTLGAGAIPAEANALRMGIKAYHGSPHDFDQFKLDPSTVRSGEGSIDEGYGIYAGEAKNVGKFYRDANTTIHLSRLARAAQPIHTQQAESIIAHVMDIVEKDGWKSLDEYEPPKGFEKAWGAVVDEFKKNEGRFGRLYKVDIDASPEEFIDLDKTLGEQPANVKDAFHRVARDPQFAINVSDDQKMTQFMPHLRKPEMMEALRDKGVKGTRYFDSGSALYGFGKVESPTRNYVVNDANLISILKKYGLPVSAAGLAALSQLHPEEAQAGGLGDRLQSE